MLTKSLKTFVAVFAFAGVVSTASAASNPDCLDPCLNDCYERFPDDPDANEGCRIQCYGNCGLQPL